jgi:hypothetical protein
MLRALDRKLCKVVSRAIAKTFWGAQAFVFRPCEDAVTQE